MASKKKAKKSEFPQWDGSEKSVGVNYGRVTPRLVGPAVERFKKLMGVCMADGCKKIDGHDGPHTQPKSEAKPSDRSREMPLAEDWGSSDQTAMNQSIHRSLKNPKSPPTLMAVMDAAEGAVDFYWDEWPEYRHGRQELVMDAARRYYNAYFPDFLGTMKKFLMGESRSAHYDYAALLDRKRASGFEALPTPVARKHESITRGESSMDAMRRLSGITPRHTDRKK